MTISHSEYLAMQRRIDAGRKTPVNRLNDTYVDGLHNKVECESDLHEEIRQECAKRGWLAFHGSMAHRTRRTVGEPDWTILADGGRTFYVECKTATGKLSVEQQGVILWAGKLGHKIHVARCIGDFLNIIKL